MSEHLKILREKFLTQQEAFEIIPCGKFGDNKRPAIPYKSTVKICKEWFTQYTSFAFKPSTHYVIMDIDPKNGGDESFKRLQEATNNAFDTAYVKTGNLNYPSSRHLYFKKSSEVTVPLHLNGYDGIEFFSRSKKNTNVGHIWTAPFSEREGESYYAPYVNDTLCTDAKTFFDGIKSLPLIFIALFKSFSTIDRNQTYATLAMDDIIKILKTVPPQAYRNYSDWFKLMCAVKHAASNDAFALRAFIQWSKKDPKYSNLDVKMLKDKWNSIESERHKKAGLKTLLMAYERHNGNSNRLKFAHKKEKLEGHSFVYIKYLNMFCSTLTPKPQNERAFNNILLTEGFSGNNPVKTILQEGLVEHVNDVRYVPIISEDAIIEIDGKKYFNTYVPPAHKHNITVDNPVVDVFLEHLNFLLHGRENEIHYVLSFMAHILQNPLQKICWAPIFYAPQEGTGRTKFFTKIYKFLLGGSNVRTIATRDIQEKYDDYLRNNQLIMCQETLVLRKDTSYGAQLRSSITDESLSIRSMHSVSEEIDIYCNYIFFTNTCQGLEFRRGDRRYAVFATYWNAAEIEERRQNGYYRKLFKWIDDPMNLEHVYSFLKTYKYSSNIILGGAPHTDASELLSSSFALGELDTVVREMEASNTYPFVNNVVCFTSLVNSIFTELDTAFSAKTTLKSALCDILPKMGYIHKSRHKHPVLGRKLTFYHKKKEISKLDIVNLFGHSLKEEI